MKEILAKGGLKELFSDDGLSLYYLNFDDFEGEVVVTPKGDYYTVNLMDLEPLVFCNGKVYRTTWSLYDAICDFACMHFDGGEILLEQVKEYIRLIEEGAYSGDEKN